jgi:hypothetical protein
MNCRRLGWISASVLSTVLVCSPLAAQEEMSFPVQNWVNVKDIRDGRKPLRDPSPDKAKQNLKDIEDAANYSVMRLTDDVNRGLKSGKTPVPMSQIVAKAHELVLESPFPPKKFDEKQVDYVNTYGAAVINPLRKILFAEKDKAPKFDPFVRMNAARILSAVGKSGYDGVAALAVDILNHPKETDAVKLYALQALKHVLAASSPDNADKSTIRDAKLETAAIQAITDFVLRPMAIPKDSPADEIEAFHYVRREGIRALGNVRFAVIRSGGAVTLAPAVVLLRYALADATLQPAPTLPERAEALIGYLQLSPDREQQMDYAGWFVGRAVRDIVAEFNARKEPVSTGAEKPGAPVAAVPAPAHRDYHPWKSTATKLSELIKYWKTNWEVNSPQPAAAVGKIMTEVTQQSVDNLLAPLLGSTLPKSPISLSEFDTFLTNQISNVTSKSLFRDDPKSIITLPRQGQ